MNSDEERLVVSGYSEQVAALDPSIPNVSSAITATDPGPLENVDRSTKKRWFILEPAVLLLFFAMSLSSAVYQNQVLYQTCIIVFKYNESSCTPLLGIKKEDPSPESKKIEENVQEYVTNILMAQSILESVIPAFISFFLGPWSDKFGRRPVIILTYTGYTISYIIMGLLTLISEHTQFSPWFYLISSLPSVFFGGTCALITVIYCYISDVAVSKARDLRMVLNEASILIGITTGSVASSFIYEATNVLTVFAISCGFMVLALLYVILFVPESLRPDQISTESRIRGFFRWDLAADLFKTCCERRPKYDRAIIWLIMLILTLSIGTMQGESSVTYLFVRERFEWTLEDFNLFNAARIIVQIGGSVLAMIVLRKYFGVSIVAMGLLALGCSVLESTARATALYSWHMYFGMIVGSLRGVTGPMCRAILSHVTPAADLGKIFALTTSLEMISPIASGPLYNLVYRATLVNNPGAFNFISSAVYMICYILMAFVYGIQKSFANSSYKEIGS
ncbi:proton-coupled folate transporter [Eupeodes corollae]|uniref:proton-coupled folate transporter n=1 Tax=Eupeodes corollae TaxID=290404 RepID=UPI00249218F4|nr:proton-coupled folate transporter [Eupeodes corollae]